MRSRTMSGLAMAGLVLLLLTTARTLGQDSQKPTPKVTPGRPAVQLRLAPLDDLIGDLRHIVKKMGREEEGKQFEELLKAKTGPKGLEGVDTKKPIGLVGNVAKRLDQSEVLFLLPIADEKTFLAFLDTADLKPKKEKDDTYTMSIENVPFPVLFRFAHGYLYGTLKFTASTTLPAADKLPKPEVALGKGTGVASLALNLDAVPDALRKAIVPAAALQLGNLKDAEIPGATEKQKELRDGALDELMRVFKQLVEDGASLAVRLDLDRKADAIDLAMHIDAPDGTSLAKDITTLSARPGLGPVLLGKDSAMGGYVNLPIPANLRKLLDPIIDEAFDKMMKDAGKDVKELFQPSIDAVKPTLKADSLALAFDLRGPGKGGKYSLVGSLRMTDGQTLEKALLDVVGKMPKEARAGIETDVAKVDGASIHRLTPEKPTARTVELFGNEKAYVAFRKDAAFVTFGESGLVAMKTALGAKPAAGKLLHLQVAMSKAGPLSEKNPKETKEAIAKAFGDKEGDKVNLTLDGGDKLDLRLRIDLAVLKLAFLLGQDQKK